MRTRSHSSAKAKHSRDLFGSPDVDHVFVNTETGNRLGGITNPGVKLYIDGSSLDEAVELTSGDLTCAGGASGVDGHSIGSGSGVPRGISMTVSEVNSKLVENNLGVGNSSGTAGSLYSAEARAFGIEMFAQYSAINLEPPGGQYRYEQLLDAMPDRGLLCATPSSVKKTNLFLVAADGLQSGHHSAGAFYLEETDVLTGEMEVGQYENGGISSFGLAQELHRTNDTSYTMELVSESLPNDLTGPCPQGTTWMQCTFPAGSAKEDRMLAELKIPGSHDSATLSLGIEPSDLETSGTGGCSGYQGVMKANVPLVRNWAVTQELNMREQLDAGIRYLDVRAGYDGSTWRPIHTIYSVSSMAREAAMIASWAKQHPNETIVVDFNHVCPFGADPDTLITEALQNADGNTGASLCSQAYKIRSASNPEASDLASRTLQDIRGGGGNVIILLDEIGGFNDALLMGCGAALETEPDYTLQQPLAPEHVPAFDEWPNQEGPPPSLPPQGYNSCADPAVAEAANQNIQEFPKQAAGANPDLSNYRTFDPIPLFQTQMIYTLDFSTAGNAITSGQLLENALEFGCPQTLIEWGFPLLPNAAPQTPTTKQEILADWGTDSNIVITDLVGSAYISQAVNLNNP